MSTKRTRNLRSAWPRHIECSWEGVKIEFANDKETFRIHLNWYYLASLGKFLQKALSELRVLFSGRANSIRQYVKEEGE